MTDTLGLYQEALQLARDLGYVVREEAIGDLPGGGCVVNGTTQVILNLERPVAERLEQVLRVLVVDARIGTEPKSRLLEARLRSVATPRN